MCALCGALRQLTSEVKIEQSDKLASKRPQNMCLPIAALLQLPWTTLRAIQA